MSSLRESLVNVFRKIPGLKSSMIVSPSETFKVRGKYDLLIVDEAHRLRQYKNIGWMGTFKKNNKKLGLDNTGTELDWIIANSKNQIFFYDSAQSVKPSDVDSIQFARLLEKKSTLLLELKSQMRVEGGNNYIQFVDELLNARRKKTIKYQNEKYELFVFDSFIELHSELERKEDHKIVKLHPFEVASLANLIKAVSLFCNHQYNNINKILINFLTFCCEELNIR